MRFFFLIFLLFALIKPTSGHELSTFYRYSNKDGLCCNYVHAISQDKNGFIWVATEYGLSRFDGVHFKNYYAEECPSLKRNQFINLFLSHDNQLLIGSNNGVLLRHNEKTDTFDDLMPEDFKTTYFKGITNFKEDNDKHLWATTTNGLYSYNVHNQTFDKEPNITDSTSATFISDMERDHFGRFFCGTYSGILLFDKDGTHLREYDQKLCLGTMVSKIMAVDKNHILVTSFVGGIWLITIGEDGEISTPKIINTPFKNTTAVIRDTRNKYWFGTAGSGLWTATYNNGSFKFQKIEPQNAQHVAEELQKIHCLYEDTEGDIWIGTQNAGILRYSSIRNSGAIHSTDIGFPIVDGTTFAETENGNILVGSDGHGLYLLSHNLQIIKHFTIEDGLSSNNVLSVKKENKDNFLIATWGGSLCRLNTTTHKISQIPYTGITHPYNTSKGVYPMKNGDIWVSFSGDGIYQCDKSGIWQKKILAYKGFKDKDIWVEDIAESDNGIRWVITSRTVWRCDGNNLFPTLPDEDLIPMHNPLSMLQGTCDNDGNLFVVSDQGVMKISEDGQKHEWLDFLPKGQYSSIVKDKNGRFWTAGSNGIVSFNPEKREYQLIPVNEKTVSRNFYTCRAAFIDSQNDIYFGSAEGFVTFDPKKINYNASVNYLGFSDLTIKGRKTEIGSEHLPVPLSELTKLKLKYDETNLKINIDVIDFSGLNNVQLFYRLDGLDPTWTKLNEQREINISHIPSGNYTLEIEARREGVQDHSKSISLNIVVSPPWWNSWWFYAIVFLSVIMTFYLIITLRFKNIIHQKEKLEVAVNERTEELKSKNEDLQTALKEKDQLISVIAHDLKNPMFSIVTALSTLLKNEDKMDADMGKLLSGIYLSAFNLQNILLKLLEWARGKREDICCIPQDKSLKKLTLDVVSLLTPLAEEKLISIKVFHDEIGHFCKMDARMIGTALRNILNNAIKFTPSKGEITIRLTESGNTVGVSISDNGVGMKQEQIDNLMHKNEIASTQGTNGEFGTGFGLKLSKEFVEKNGGTLSIKSDLGKGSIFTILLPKSEISETKAEENNDGKKGEVVDKDFNINIKTKTTKDNTILIVEDDKNLLLHEKNILSQYFNIITATNGNEGFKITLKNAPDIILSDIEMPICDGIEMYERIKKQPELTHIPLIFVSARSKEEDKLMGLNKGAIDYLTKPFSEQELLMKVVNILQIRNLQRQNYIEKYPNVSQEEQENVDPLLKSVMDIVAKRYADADFSAEDICTELTMSKSTFFRKLKNITSKTPTEILTDYRMTVARNLLLQNKNLSVSEVAYSVGFNDPFYFSRKFKSYFNCNPSDIK